MGRGTQRVDPSALDSLAARPPRAAIAFTLGDRVEAVPIAFRRAGEKIWVGLDRSVQVGNETSTPAVVLVDDGQYWFELRAITWRGRLVPAHSPMPTLAAELQWFEFVVEGSVAWDYGTLHEEP